MVESNPYSSTARHWLVESYHTCLRACCFGDVNRTLILYPQERAAAAPAAQREALREVPRNAAFGGGGGAARFRGMGGAVPSGGSSGGRLVPRMLVPAAMDISGLLGPGGGGSPPLSGSGARAQRHAPMNQIQGSGRRSCHGYSKIAGG